MNREALFILRTRLRDAPGGRPRGDWLTVSEALFLLDALLEQEPATMRAVQRQRALDAVRNWSA